MDLKHKTRIATFLISMLLITSACNEATTSHDLKELIVNDKSIFISELTSNMTSDFIKAESIISWLALNFDWKATDYQKRSVQQIIERGGGNCNDLAKVAMNLMDSANIKIRKVQEINIYEKSDQRQITAEGLVKEKGNKLSVFGKMHNDHVWIEIYDQNTKEWLPADPSLGLAGLDNWMKGRVAFEERKTLDPGSADMIIPMAIFAQDENGKLSISRSEYYLIESFDRMYDNKLSMSPLWPDWSKGIKDIDKKCLSAFRGEENLHDYESDIESLLVLYNKLKSQYLKPIL